MLSYHPHGLAWGVEIAAISDKNKSVTYVLWTVQEGLLLIQQQTESIRSDINIFVMIFFVFLEWWLNIITIPCS